MIPLLFSLTCAVFLARYHYRCTEALAATHAWCDASNAFVEWRLRNQGVYIGLSKEGRDLLAANLQAYDWFLRTHKYVEDDGHREWLVKMFYDFPPQNPHDTPTPRRSNQSVSILFYCFLVGFFLGSPNTAYRFRFKIQ
jgi:hypothetical protein